MKDILRRTPRLVMIGVVIIALLSVSIMAYLSTSSGEITNIFKPATEKTPTILEGADGNSFDGVTKSQVKVDVGKTGYAVYVRAAIIVNWEENKEDSGGNKTIVDNTGKYLADVPVLDADYTIQLNTAPGSPWFLGSDGFYYHKAMVNSEASTADLIQSCKVIAGKAPSGYHLDVQIVAQTIQAPGGTDADNTPAVEDAWKVVNVDPGSKELVAIP